MAELKFFPPIFCTKMPAPERRAALNLIALGLIKESVMVDVHVARTGRTGDLGVVCHPDVASHFRHL
jgi:hypothetical protein